MASGQDDNVSKEDGSGKMEVGSHKLEDDSDKKSEKANQIEETSIAASIKIDEMASTLAITQPTTNNQPIIETKVSSLSLASIKAKKELQEAQKGLVKEEVHLPSEVFTETQMQAFWFKFADRLSEKGHRIMESLLRISDPKLDGFKIIHEMPNDGSKIDFEREKHELLTYLRSHLHNHEISIEIVVNEQIDSKKAFTAIDKYNRLNEINPNLEVLKKLFDLDL